LLQPHASQKLYWILLALPLTSTHKATHSPTLYLDPTISQSSFPSMPWQVLDSSVDCLRSIAICLPPARQQTRKSRRPSKSLQTLGIRAAFGTRTTHFVVPIIRAIVSLHPLCRTIWRCSLSPKIQDPFLNHRTMQTRDTQQLATKDWKKTRALPLRVERRYPNPLLHLNHPQTRRFENSTRQTRQGTIYL